MAGQVPSIAQSIAFGIGSAAEALTDAKLQFEVGRSDITLTSLDMVNSRLVFKAPVDETASGEIREVAIYSTSRNEIAGSYGSALITTFDSATEDWINIATTNPSQFSTSTHRVGADGLVQSAAASGNSTDALQEVSLDLSGFSAADKFVFAFNASNAFVSSIRYRFMTDAANYYDVTVGAQTAGYKIIEVTKASATVTGAPDWGNITEIRVTVNSTAGGSAGVVHDAIRIEDVDTVNPDYVLVAREVLSPLFIKEEGKVQEVEFSLDINL